MRNLHARGLSHPKGRILNHRPENAVDLDEVFMAAETESRLEVNGLPDRLDLSAAHVEEALAAGIRLVLSSTRTRRAGSPMRSSPAPRRAKAARRRRMSSTRRVSMTSRFSDGADLR